MKLIIRLLMFIAAILICCNTVKAQNAPINIWEGTGCKATVRLTPYLVEGKDNTAVIICPGGSYFWLDKKTEGIGVAQWLNSQGISAFVLEYRVGGIFGFITHHRLIARGNRYPDPLQDIQRSIQLIRENAEDFGIDSGRLGVMGFSAGGHLTAMSGIFFDTDVLSQFNIHPEVSLKPDFIAPIYPVVSFVDKSTHKRSRRGLLGEGKSISRAMKDSLSLERHVRADMPPTFLMNCMDDPIVRYRNSELLDSALTAKGVNHQYVQFKTGGHGFGATPGKTTPEAIAWREIFINWLKNTLK